MELLRETFGDYAIVTIVRTPKYLTGPKVGQDRDPYFVVEARSVNPTYKIDNLLEYRLCKTLAGARIKAEKFREFYGTMEDREVIVWVCMNCGCKFENSQVQHFNHCSACGFNDLKVYKRTIPELRFRKKATE